MLRAECLAVFLAAITLAMGLALPQGNAAAPGKAHYVIGKPYQCDGVWYQPAVDDSYNQTGLANVYPSGRNGLSTTSGEAYDENAIAGAHKTLPLPCFVRVTNLANGKAITLRLNDRGPFVDDRIIELTPAAARALNIAGLAQVRVEIMAKESQALAAALGGNDQGPQPAASIAPVPTPVVKVTNLPLSNGTSMQPMKPVAAPGVAPPAPYASAPATAAPAVPAAALAPAPAPTSAAPTAATIPLAIPLPPAPAPAASAPAVTAPAATAPASTAPVPTTPAAIAPAPTPPAPTPPTPPTPPKPSPAAATIVAPPASAPAVTIPASATPAAPKAVPAVSVSITNASVPAVPTPAAVPPAASPVAPAIPVQLSSVPATPAVKPLPVDLPAQFFIQTGAFKNSAQADQLREKLAPLGPAKIVPTRLGNDPFNAVLLGPIPSMADAQRLLKQITGMGYSDAVLIIE